MHKVNFIWLYIHEMNSLVHSVSTYVIQYHCENIVLVLMLQLTLLAFRLYNVYDLRRDGL